MKELKMLIILFTLFLPASVSAEYVVNYENQTVLDTSTGLTWERYGDEIYYTNFESALSRIEELNQSSASNWRLPTKMELVNFHDYIYADYSLYSNEVYWANEGGYVAVFIGPDGPWLSYPSSAESARVLAVRSGTLPVAKTGPDKVVLNSVTLDGSESFDQDGTIVSWKWSLYHRTNPSFNREATGSNPTLNNLDPGFYDVVLTVEDNIGGTGTDNMLLAVSGLCDINGDGRIGLPEAIKALQICAGLKIY